MGWRERDWAKFNDAEWQTIYGFRAPRAETARPVDRTRRVVWTTVVVAAIAVVGTAFAIRVPTGGTLVPPPAVLYGVAGSGSDAETPGGANTVCTEMAIASTSGEWSCLSWVINVNHAIVEPARTFSGQCTHVTVDQASGAWTCVSRIDRPEQEV